MPSSVLKKKRYIDNLLPEWNEATQAKEVLTPETVQQIRHGRDQVLKLIHDNIDPTAAVGTSVYTGAAGLAYMYFHLHRRKKERGSLESNEYLDLAVEYIEASLRRLKRQQKRQGGVSKHVGFLDGESGPLAVACLIYAEKGDEENRKASAKDLVCVCRIATHENINANELLYGRAGALHSLLLAKSSSPDFIEDSLIHELCDKIMGDGHLQGNFKCPLVWEWHNKKYLGSAHGIAGILYVLLDVPYVRRNAAWMRDILNTVYFIVTQLQFPDGNFPTRIDHYENHRSMASKLVQWCHGAPGVLPLLVKTIRLLTERDQSQSTEEVQTYSCDLSLIAINIPKFIYSLERAVTKAQRHIWERGLLLKGVGLCHGISGNALSAFKTYTDLGSIRGLHEAVTMALFCVDVDNLSMLFEVPDHPISLFEGVAGLVWLLTELDSIQTGGGQGVFPALDVV